MVNDLFPRVYIWASRVRFSVCIRGQPHIGGSVRFGSSRVGPGQVGRVGPGRVGPGRVGSGRVGSGRAKSSRVGSGRDGTGRAGPGRVGPGRVGSGRVGSGRVRWNPIYSSSEKNLSRREWVCPWKTQSVLYTSISSSPLAIQFFWKTFSSQLSSLGEQTKLYFSMIPRESMHNFIARTHILRKSSLSSTHHPQADLLFKRWVFKTTTL